MSVLWIAPLAMGGVALIALPIALHLLVRHQVRTLAYPSLRFLRETQLAAFRRHRIEDLALLICRCAIVALAAFALAGPVVQTPSRLAEQANRTSRAIVSIGAVPADVSARLTQESFASAAIQRAEVGDALRDAVRWLEAQPRSAREIVVAGELRRGTITEADLAAVPGDVGVRFEPGTIEAAGDVEWPVLARRDDRLVRIEQSVTAAANSTRLITGATTVVGSDLVTIIASSRDAALADAALRAALDAGVPWRDFNKRVMVVWDGADDSLIEAQPAGATVARMPVPVPAATAADAVRAELLRASGARWVEPIAIGRAELGAWTRPPADPFSNAPVTDEGDRRWLWALALTLLGVELRLRRSSTSAVAVRKEARVA